MNSKMVKLAVAAVIAAGALTVGVERLTRSRPSRVQAFKAQIRANTALDLDPEAALPLRDARPEDFDVTWSSEHGGSLKILPGSSLRMWAITLINPRWDDVMGWAFSHLADIQKSEATSVVPTEQTRFAAVLTSEGNLAVVQIDHRNEEMAWLSWRVEKAVSPGYSPVQTLTLRSVDVQSATGGDCAVDLDTGAVRSIPADVLSMPAGEMLGWLEQNGIDAIATMSDEGLSLNGVGLVFEPWGPGSWAGTSAVDLRERMISRSFEPRLSMAYRKGEYQLAFPFKTREGGIGMLQILAVDESERAIQFRYRVVQAEDGVRAETEDDAESQQLSESVKRLMHFGLLAWNYADEHDGRFPETLEQLKAYAKRFDQDFGWIRDNVGYVGAGGTTNDPNPGDTVLAYDRTLLATGKGTYAVFRDGHAEFLPPDLLAKYGLSDKPQDAPPMSPR